MAFSIPAGTEAELAAEFRKRALAKHIRLIAASIFAAETRAMVMRIAEPIETKSEDDRG